MDEAKLDDGYLMEDPFDESNAEVKAGHSRKKTLVICIVVAICIIAAAIAGYFIYQSTRPADISTYAHREIALVGIEDEPIMLSVQQISEMECVDLVANGAGLANSRQKSKTGDVAAHGPTLDTLLTNVGAKKSDFTSMICEGYNGYTNTITAEQLEEEIVCSIAEGNEPLDRDYQPLYIILPDDGTDTWCYGVVTITFEKAE